MLGLEGLLIGVATTFATGYIKQRILNAGLKKVMDKSSLKNSDFHQLAFDNCYNWVGNHLKKRLK
jgi:hypothetical protein